MGTNYYLVDETEKCLHCGHNPIPDIHIGKACVGWPFLFRRQERLGILSGSHWIAYLTNNPDAKIINEYGEAIDIDKLLDWIESKQQGATEYRIADYDFC